MYSRETVRIRYLLLCVDNTVRSNHFDDTHLHLMPPLLGSYRFLELR